MRPARNLTSYVVVAALAVALGVASARAQDPTLDVEIASLDQSDAGTLHAVVNVLDAAGRPLPSLTTENVRATLQGKPAPVLDVQAAVNASFGIDVLLVVDTSGSMQGTPLEQARAAAERFMDGLGPHDRVAVLTFGDTVTTVQDFTSNAETVTAVLEDLEATGNTALYQATADSARMAVASASARKAIIFLSDGLDNGGKSRISREDSLSAAETLGVPTFVIGLGDQTDRSYLSELAEVTGGRFLETPSPQGLAQLYEDIANFLRGQYVVSIDVTGADLQQPTSVHLEVSIDGATGSAERTLKPPRLPAGPPTVTISGLLPGQEVSASTTIVTEVVSEDPLSALIFRVDDINVYQLEEPPFQYELDPEVFAEGTHTLRVEAVTTFGEVGTDEVDFAAVAATAAVPLDRFSPEPFIMAGSVVIAGSLAVLYILWRRRRRHPEEAQVQIRSLAGLRQSPKPLTVDWEKAEIPPAEAEIVQEPMGRIVVTSGPLAGRQFPVGASPVTIGSGHRCAVALPDEEGRIAPEEARVWVRNGHLMVHRLSHLSNASGEEQSAGWSILDLGDHFQIGGCRFRFEAVSEADEAEQGTPSADGSAPSVLRDDSDLARGQESPTES
ncbi:MAG: VWA domain-containing protein [Dehalococcoidia bacterium]